MKTATKYLYSFANASLTLRAIEYLRDRYRAILDSVTVINLIDRWLIEVNLKASVEVEQVKNLTAILSELGLPYQPLPTIVVVLASLKIGATPVEVMNRYQVVVVAYGQPEKEEIEIFRKQIVEGLGYCPPNMA